MSICLICHLSFVRQFKLATYMERYCKDIVNKQDFFVPFLLYAIDCSEVSDRELGGHMQP